MIASLAMKMLIEFLIIFQKQQEHANVKKDTLIIRIKINVNFALKQFNTVKHV